MYTTASRLIELGVSKDTLQQKVSTGEWKVRPFSSRDEPGETNILVSSLPRELRMKWAQANLLPDYPEQIAVLLSEAAEYGLNERTEEITELLIPLTPAERRAWIEEALRMSRVVEKYRKIKPKRQRNAVNGDYEFVTGVHELCQETVCTDLLILGRHPHKGEPLSPYTLDDLYREYREHGMLAFLPKVKKIVLKEQDARRAFISAEAVEWVNKHWSRFSGPRFLYNALKDEVKKKDWEIPSESWFYRCWGEMSEIVRTYYLEGNNAYISKYAPYLPRDYSDLQVLQVVCGDHSLRDVTITMPDGTITRPSLSLWLDLRSGLIWGWYLSTRPSSHTAALAYANGVRTFGAQPPSRPDAGYHSFIYTDRGRDFRARNWDGTEIVVSKKEMNLDSALEMLLVERRVGILDDLNIKHILARGYNAREKPVERIFKIISEWEQNNFKEYCGRDPKSKPEAWHALYRRYERRAGKGRSSSPFITFEQYREQLAEFIWRFNNTTHERPTLNSEPIVPLDEYKRLYTTRYEIPPKTLALIIMKSARRKIGKLGVNCFRKSWNYYHDAMSEFKGRFVEVRYSEDDYSRVFVVLPDGVICEALLITRTSIINPNKETIKVVKKIQAHDKEVIRNFQLIAQSNSRGETVEDRASHLLEAHGEETEGRETMGEESKQSQVFLWTRLERKKLYAVSSQREVTVSDVAGVEADLSIFDATPVRRFSEQDEE
jgi:transposase InsO family protein